MVPAKTQSDIVATSTLRDTQYEQKTFPKPQRLDGLLKEVTVEGVSEATKAAFGCKFSNCLRIDLETHVMREKKQRQEDSLIAMKMLYQI